MQEDLSKITSTLKYLGKKVDQIANKVEAGVKPKFKCNVDQNNINVKDHNSCYDKVKELGYKELIVENDGCIGAPNLYRYKVLDNDENKVAEFYTLKGVKDYLDKKNKNA
ncbi:MAG: hypothetical protein F6K56_15565 [Moorea sp. SIO3G5]|nr:hypothetical protein [Moorena sp. SIO3G5]